MTLPEEIAGGAAAGLEDWLLSAMDRDPMPVDDMLAAVLAISESGDTERADSSAELVQDALVAAKDAGNVVNLLKLRSGWTADTPGFRAACRAALADAFGNRLGQSFIKACGFGDGIPVSECLRRLETLTRLAEGVQCYEKTWGFGVVVSVDDFYEKVTIDFDGKRGHQMSFAYAAESLAFVDDSHILARRHNDPDALAELVEGQPGEVVRLALRSYGELSAVDLQEKLVDGIVPADRWKKFWDAARKELKGDPLVEIPAKRKDPIRLLDRQKEYDADWFLTFKGIRDPEQIFLLIDELQGSAAGAPSGYDEKAVLADRLALCIKAGEGGREDLVARALMAASRLGLSDELLAVEKTASELMDPARFLTAVAGLPARLVRPFIEYCSARAPEATTDLLLSVLPDMQQNVLGEALDFLTGTGHEDRCRARFEPIIGARKAGPEILYWLARHTDAVADWVSAGPQEFLVQVIDSLEGDYSGERLKSKNQLRALFENKEWLEGLLCRLSDDGRAEVLRRIDASRGWDTSSRRSVLARIIRMYPDLERVLAATAQVDEKPKAGPQTSWRSYRARQEQYRKLIEEDIPKNSKEIAVARSYGDLRENFEYQAAKDQQRLLLRRKAEVEEDLKNVRGTDFDGAPANAVGPGTTAMVRSSTGVERQYCILGEWDQDDTLAIVSSSSRVAQILEGRRVGDTVPLPTAGGDVEQCTVVAISGLSEDVKKWVMG